MPYSIIPTQVDDYPALRDLQIASWQNSYKGLMTAEFLQIEMPGRLAERWSNDLGDNWRVFGAWDSTELVGFITVDMTHDGGPYVDNLHVAKSAWGQGIATQLMAKAAEVVLQEGESSLWLTVVTTNDRAVRFYQHIGGERGEDRTEYPMGQSVEACPMRWPNSGALSTLSQFKKTL